MLLVNTVVASPVDAARICTVAHAGRCFSALEVSLSPPEAVHGEAYWRARVPHLLADHRLALTIASRMEMRSPTAISDLRGAVQILEMLHEDLAQAPADAPADRPPE